MHCKSIPNSTTKPIHPNWYPRPAVPREPVDAPLYCCADCHMVIPDNRVRCADCQRAHESTLARKRYRAWRDAHTAASCRWNPRTNWQAVKAAMPQWLKGEA